MSVKQRPNRKRIQPIFMGATGKGVGSSPGTPFYIGDRTPIEATYSLIQYDKNSISVVTPESIEEIVLMDDPDMVNWVNVNGFAKPESIKRLCAFLKLDPLTVEDIFNTEHRPKVEDFGHYLFLITKMLKPREDGTIEYEQVSFILTETMVITFQEAPGDCFDPVRERLKTGAGRLRKLGSDYLLYALLDVIVDNYFTILEHLGTSLEEFEEDSTASREASTFMSGLQRVKADLNHLRRVLWPIRDAINALIHAESGLIDDELAPFLRDLHENTVQVLEVLEFYRETASGIQEVFLSSLSNRMNEVMKVLTIISTIFIPLTFIAGVYGMNFRYIPELDSPFGYPAIWGVMVLVAAGLLIYFKRRKWL